MTGKSIPTKVQCLQAHDTLTKLSECPETECPECPECPALTLSKCQTQFPSLIEESECPQVEECPIGHYQLVNGHLGGDANDIGDPLGDMSVHEAAKLCDDTDACVGFTIRDGKPFHLKNSRSVVAGRKQGDVAFILVGERENFVYRNMSGQKGSEGKGMRVCKAIFILVLVLLVVRMMTGKKSQ